MNKKWPGKRKVTKEKKREINWHKVTVAIIIILNCLIISGLGVNAYITNGELRQLKNHMTYLSDTSNIILSGVDNMQADIEQTLKEEASLIEDWAIDLEKTNFSAGTYTVKITVIPKEYTDSTQVEVYFGTKKFDLKLKNYKYVGEAKLSFRNRYDGNVTVLLVNGKKKSTEVLSSYQDVQARFEGVLSGGLKEIPEFKDGVMSVDQDFEYAISDENNLAFMNLDLIIEADGKELERFDLLKEPEPEEEKSETDDEEAELEGEEETEILETIQELQPVYMIEGSYHVKQEYILEPGTDIRIYLSASCQEGFTFSYNLFCGVTQEDAVKGFQDAEDYFAPDAKVFDTKGVYYFK